MIDRDTVIDVLTKCTGYDPRTPHPSDVVLAAWTEHFADTDLTRDELLAAVAEHYAIPDVSVAMPAALSSIAYARRREALEAAERYAPRVSEPIPDSRIGRLAARKAIDELLDAKGKIGRADGPRRIPCPFCTALAGEPCVQYGTDIPLARPPYFHPSRIEAAGVAASRPCPGCGWLAAVRGHRPNCKSLELTATAARP